MSKALKLIGFSILHTYSIAQLLLDFVMLIGWEKWIVKKVLHVTHSYLEVGLINWSNKHQPTIALSSMEVKYKATTKATKDAIWIKRLL
jgi:hypothetical protein